MTDWHEVPVFGAPPAGVTSVIRPSAYGLLADAHGLLAVVLTPEGVYLPGGGTEGDERPEATVVREVREECGLIVKVGTWRRTAIDHVASIVERAQFEKHCTFCDAAVIAAAGAAIELDHELVWMLPDEAAKQLTPAGHRWAVSEWLATRAMRARGGL